MPALQVRDVPEQVYRKLRMNAQKEHRSLSQEVVVILEKGLGVAVEPLERRRRLIEEILAHQPIKTKKKLPDPVRLIREDRDR